ncbi:molecular chaperone DnaJ [Novosphingopyxis baekryungensis]|jgi:DnaJ-domain-containing protein 1|uniref:molecular chaperone DnaJ n=1 Tax=Novosphingopyxis baekryungensis TaxID=279369 RepID=UPI0003B46C1E|nr:molecular chaperone DnaJ [Novosphingopyxis baekryungensis]
MGKLLLLAILAAVAWFWWRGKNQRLQRQENRPLDDAARLLGVAPQADADTIRAAWRRQVAALRPDQTNDAASLEALTDARDRLLARATGRPRQ